MGWPLRRRLYLTLENEDSHLTPLGVEEWLNPLLERALSATNATGAAIALNEGKEMVCLAAQGTAPDLGTRLDPQFGFPECVCGKAGFYSVMTRRRTHELIVW